jgi:5,10-methylenetetrahydrofolate reductase
VRGALGNGVQSFLVVVGDTMPQVDHLADHFEIARHLHDLQAELPEFEIGMPTRFQAWQKRRRVEAGAQFLVCGPILDPTTVASQIAQLELEDGDPPVFLMVIPPFGPTWVERMASMGAVPAGNDLVERLTAATSDERRDIAWEAARRIADEAEAAGCAGAILMGLSFETIVDEAALEWRVRT